jgi:hypothetical protein
MYFSCGLNFYFDIYDLHLHGSTMYFSCGHNFYFYISHVSIVYIFCGHGHKLCFHYSWIRSVLDLEAMLTSLLSMAIPDLGREYLMCLCCRYCSIIARQLHLPRTLHNLMTIF